MKRQPCRHIEALILDNVGALPAEAQSHIDECDTCRDLARLVRNVHRVVPKLAPPPVPPLMVRRAVLAAVNGRIPSRPGRQRRHRRRLVLAGAVFLLLLAASTGLVLTFRDTGESGDRKDGKHAIAADAASTTTGTPLPVPSSPAIDGESSQYSVQFDAETTPLILMSSTIWGAKATSLSVEDTTGSCSRILLHRGKIVVEVNPRDLQCRFTVITPSATVEVRGTIFSVEIADDATETVRVLEGSVAVSTEATHGEAKLVIQSHQLKIGEETPVLAAPDALERDARLANLISRTEPPKISGAHDMNHPIAKKLGARDLLKQAKAFRKKRNFSMARTMYLNLIAEHPKSNCAANALVALAQMEQGVLDDKTSALARYADYLAQFPNGPLVDEAWIGRIRILASLQRHPSVIESATAYLEQRVKGARRSEVLRRRGDAYARLGACDRSIADYRTVVEQWPSSKEARIAERGIRRCESKP